MAYVSFVTDDDLLECIEHFYEKCEKAKEKSTIEDFYKNQIDPIKAVFDMKFLNLSKAEWVEWEIQRQIDKSISNAIGDFHEELLGKIDGYERHIKKGYDITDTKKEYLFADIKNKYNTVKSSDRLPLYEKLESYIEKKPNAKAYWVQIISDGKSFNKPWILNYKDKDKKQACKENKRVYMISGDKFYELLTGNANSFAELCEALPKAVNDFSNNHKITQLPNSQEIYDKLSKDLKGFMNHTFGNYNGFPIKDNK